MIDYGEFTVKFDTQGIEGLYEWIDDNFKCIPKGENRHPYADVLHELLEGVAVEVYNKVHQKWKDVGKDCIYDGEYRIKPSEPVYEYLYYSRIGNTIWSTKDDAPTNMWCAEETKRERN